MMSPQTPDLHTHAAMERDKLTAAVKHVHLEANAYLNSLEGKASKRHKAIHNSACNTIEEVATNKNSAEDMLEKTQKRFSEQLTRAEQAADAAAKRQLNELRKMEEAMCSTLAASCKQT